MFHAVFGWLRGSNTQKEPNEACFYTSSGPVGLWALCRVPRQLVVFAVLLQLSCEGVRKSSSNQRLQLGASGPFCFPKQIQVSLGTSSAVLAAGPFGFSASWIDPMSPPGNRRSGGPAELEGRRTPRTNGCGSKIGAQNGTLVSGHMDQNLRSPGAVILTHIQIKHGCEEPTPRNENHALLS